MYKECRGDENVFKGGRTSTFFNFSIFFFKFSNIPSLGTIQNCLANKDATRALKRCVFNLIIKLGKQLT